VSTNEHSVVLRALPYSVKSSADGGTGIALQANPGRTLLNPKLLKHCRLVCTTLVAPTRGLGAPQHRLQGKRGNI
jgi:hypothetical protein